MTVFDRWVPLPMFLAAALAAISPSTRFSLVMLALLAAGAFAWYVAHQDGSGPSSVPEELI